MDGQGHTEGEASPGCGTLHLTLGASGQVLQGWVTGEQERSQGQGAETAESRPSLGSTRSCRAKRVGHFILGSDGPGPNSGSDLALWGTVGRAHCSSVEGDVRTVPA